ncbi:hypothetical protein [Streptomyces sp. URMC 123]|uniref:hypothetical protein n=1 Tax=Streptomyces sp. URMC 123 TaxID=3423403 RepID=UPI003F1B1101
MTRAFLLLGQAVVVVFTLHSLWVLLSVLVVARWLGRGGRPATRPLEAPPTVVVLLPALREQRLVAETLSFYATVDYPGRLLPIVVTSEREEAERREREQALVDVFARLGPGCTAEQLTRSLSAALSPTAGKAVAGAVLRAEPADAAERLRVARQALRNLPTTAQVCDRVIADLRGREGTRPCYRLHYPDTVGRKGSQLNHAVARLDTLGLAEPIDPRDTLVAVYDFDAVPHPGTFTAVAAEAARRRAAHRPLPRMMQQVQVPFTFRDRFAGGLDGLLMRGQVLYWLRRGLGVELRRLLFKEWLERRRLPRAVKGVARPLIYGIGSGMFFRLDALGVAGPFPEPHDDLAMGYRASFMGWETVPVRSFNLTEPYYSTASLVRAWGNVAYAGTRIVDDLRHVRRRGAPSPLRGWEQWALVAREWLDTLVWFLGTLLVPVAMVASAFTGPGWLLLSLGALVLAYPLTAAVVLFLVPRLGEHLGTGGAAPWLRGRRATALLIATFVAQPFVSSAGPWSLAGRAVATGRRDATLVTGKTER